MQTGTRHISQAIRTARTERALTQGELAVRLGVSQSTISFWENGTEVPTVEHLIILALELPQIVESFEGRERELAHRSERRHITSVLYLYGRTRPSSSLIRRIQRARRHLPHVRRQQAGKILIDTTPRHAWTGVKCGTSPRRP